MPGRPLVVGVDGSAASHAAVRWAAATAARRHAPLHLVYAVGVQADAVPVLGSLLFETRGYREAGKAALDLERRFVRQLGTAVGDINVETFLESSTPVTALASRSGDAQLLAVGNRGLDPLERVLLGSVGIGLIRHADCPVAIIPAAVDISPPSPHRPILVGVDGSPCSVRAVGLAFDEASTRGVGLVAVAAWSHRSPSALATKERIQALLARSLAGLAEKYPDVCVDSVVAEGRSAQRLLEASGAAQLIVLGSRGRGGIAGAALGSVSQAVLEGSRIPVLITPCRQ
ncbi:universal stress protein [Nocardia gamkensis]|uniref:universal stress protein n=1 Tax=Nocardia gamkensis TaxID=352869 RepID=UPI0037CB7EAE